MKTYQIAGIVGAIGFALGWITGVWQSAYIISTSVLDVLKQAGYDETTRRLVQYCLARQGLA